MMLAGELEGQQMRHLAAFVVGFAVVSSWAGAQDASQPPRAKPGAFARIVEREHGLRKPIPELERPDTVVKEPPPTQPAEFNLLCSLMALRDADLTDLGIARERPATTASPELRQKLTERARAVRSPAPLVPCVFARERDMLEKGFREGAILVSANFTFPSGQRVYLPTCANHNYVAGVSLEDFVPIIGNAAAGLFVEAKALPLGAETLFTMLSVWVNAFHSIQTVELEPVEVAAKDRKAKVRPMAQEACMLLRKSAEPTPCSLRVRAGESLVVPLGDVSFLVAKSNLRAYAREGRVRIQRDDTQKLLSRADERGYPLDEDVRVLVVLTPTIVRSEDHSF